MGARTKGQTDGIAEFFTELRRRGNEPLLENASGSGRVDIEARRG